MGCGETSTHSRTSTYQRFITSCRPYCALSIFAVGDDYLGESMMDVTAYARHLGISS